MAFSVAADVVTPLAVPVTGASGAYALENRRSGFVPLVNRKNGVPIAEPWQALPSALNGVAMHEDEIGSRTFAMPAPSPVGVSGMLLWSSTNVGLAALTKWPAKPSLTPLTCWRHVT